MQVITTEISDKTIAKLNDNSITESVLIPRLLHFYGRWEGFNFKDQKYDKCLVTKVTNTGIRIDVDGTEIDIMWKWKYAWIFSAKNPATNATFGTVSDEIIRLIQSYIDDARLVGAPKWKTMTKQYYKNGRNGETINRYNTYTGSKSNFKYT